ncbi:MAG: RDD family protein [Flavobacteriales bacterium]|jgi:uncharacterized RDD family membrane protein YckC
MKSIELQTTQNVRINYELAAARERVVAFVIDVAALAISLFIITFLGVMLFAQGANEIMVMLYFLGLGLVVTFYSLVFEVYNNGQTLGKMVMKIQVMRMDGRQLVFTDYLLRWIFRLIDIWFSLGAIAVVMVSSSSKAQRLGDLVSNTVVVRTRPRMPVTLKDVLRIETASVHTPSYPAVRQFKERDMMVLKQTVDRAARYRNPAHSKALNLAAQRAAELIGLDKVPGDPEQFLRTLIKDYIVLTR